MRSESLQSATDLSDLNRSINYADTSDVQGEKEQLFRRMDLRRSSFALGYFNQTPD